MTRGACASTRTDRGTAFWMKPALSSHDLEHSAPKFEKLTCAQKTQPHSWNRDRPSTALRDIQTLLDKVIGTSSTRPVGTASHLTSHHPPIIIPQGTSFVHPPALLKRLIWLAPCPCRSIKLVCLEDSRIETANGRGNDSQERFLAYLRMQVCLRFSVR